MKCPCGKCHCPICGNQMEDATNLVFERVVQYIKSDKAVAFDYQSMPHGRTPEEWADWLLANRSEILGIKGEVNEGEK